MTSANVSAPLVVIELHARCNCCSEELLETHLKITSLPTLPLKLVSDDEWAMASARTVAAFKALGPIKTS